MSGLYQTIWLMNRNGSGQVQLTAGFWNDTFPRFGPPSSRTKEQ